MWAILGQIFILAGTGLFAIAGIGLVVVGALAIQPGLADGVKVVAIVAFQLTTSAVATSAMGRAAYLSQAPLRRLTFDDLTPTEVLPSESEGEVGG